MDSLAGAKVLLLDDEPMVTRALDALLRLQSEFEPCPFNIPEAALDFIEREPVDAIVADFVMPGMDGLDFLTRARRVQPSCSRILLTGYADKQSAIRAINEIGLFRYLEKPWNNDDLLLAVRNAVERSRLVRLLEERTRDLEELRGEIGKLLL